MREGLVLAPHVLGALLGLARGLPLSERELDRFLIVVFRVLGRYISVGGERLTGVVGGRSGLSGANLCLS